MTNPFSSVPGFNDLILVRLTHEDIRVIKTHGAPDEEFLAALEKGCDTADGFLVGCRRECIIDVNCVLAAVSEELDDVKEVNRLLKTFKKLEAYEF